MQANGKDETTDTGQLIACLPLPDLDATAEVAARLSAALGEGDVVALKGDLGAGKTAFARALLEAMGVREDIPSPTFTLVQTYQPPACAEVWHVDLYRIEDPSEVLELGLEEAFADAISLIEWPEKLGEELPADALELVFLITDPETGARELSIHGGEDWKARLKEVYLA